MSDLVYAPRRLLATLIRGYQRFLSPALPPSCRFHPSCSQYALEAVTRYEREMLDYMRSRHADVLGAIRSTGKLEDDVEKKLAAALDEFGKIFQPSASASRAA